MAPISRFRGVLVTLLSLLAMSEFAFPCSVDRRVNNCTSGDCFASAQADFAAYAEDEGQCGVSANSRPFLMKAEGTPKGTIVLVHGLSASPDYVRDLARELRKEGYNVVAPILHGHGGSDDLLKSANLNQWKADVAFAGAEAEKLDKPLYIMGHSTGGVMAGLEASLHPGKYKAIIGLDPALNVNGRDGWKVRDACIAKHLWSYPSEIPNFQNPFNRPTVCAEGENAIGHEPQSLKVVSDLEVKKVLEKYCSMRFKNPSFNYEFTLPALCSLARATAEMTGDRMAKLPPSLMFLSQDKQVFGYISKQDLRNAVQANPQNKVVDSKDPLHALMALNCSPGFGDNMKEIKAWLASHR